MGSFEWTVPDDGLFVFVTDLVRPMAPTSTAGACTTRWHPGRRYPRSATESELMADFANVWQAAEELRLLHDFGRCVDRQYPTRAQLWPRLNT